MVNDPMVEKIEIKKTSKIEEPIPEICTFRGIRRVVMKRVWEKADKLEKEGKPLLHSDFGKMVSDEWDIVKKEVPKVCPLPVGAQKIMESSQEPTETPTETPPETPEEPSRTPTETPKEPSKEPKESSKESSQEPKEPSESES